MVTKGNLGGFKWGIVVCTKQAGQSISETAELLKCTTMSNRPK